MNSPCSVAVPALLALLGLSGANAADKVTAERQDHALTIRIGGEEFTTYRFAPDQPKPYFSPVRAPGGAVITRPVNDPEDKDHPHHRGIWNAVDEVNEVDFWAEKGKIVSRDVQWSQAGDSVQILVKNDWMGPEQPVLHESSTVTIHPNRLIVYHMTFTKPENVPTVTFGDTKEGMFGIRVASSMRGKVGGIISNADGLKTEKECWGKTTKWVDYAGKAGDALVGVAIFDHPKNFRPSRFHCRDYGLFTISPFGEGAYQNDPAKAKPVVLDAQRPRLELTYGLYVHKGDAAEGRVAEAYDAFLNATK